MSSFYILGELFVLESFVPKILKCNNWLRMFEKQYFIYTYIYMTHFLHRILLGAWVRLSTYFDFFMTLPQLTSGSKNLGLDLYKVFWLGAEREKTR